MSMRNVEVEGATYLVPSYVVRVPGGWQARPPKQKSTFFADGNYGGIAFALRECVFYMQDLGMLTGSTQRKESATKTTPLGASGVFLEWSPRRGRRAAHYRLHVLLPDRRRTTIYLGTSATYEKRLPQKLQEAVAKQQAARLQQQRAAMDFAGQLS